MPDTSVFANGTRTTDVSSAGREPFSPGPGEKAGNAPLRRDLFFCAQSSVILFFAPQRGISGPKKGMWAMGLPALSLSNSKTRRIPRAEQRLFHGRAYRSPSWFILVPWHQTPPAVFSEQGETLSDAFRRAPVPAFPPGAAPANTRERNAILKSLPCPEG